MDSKMLYGRIKAAGDFAWLKAVEENDRIILFFIKEQAYARWKRNPSQGMLRVALMSN